MVARRVWTTVILPLCFVVRATAAVLYVDVNGTNSVAPYTNWATAAFVIQDAVDAASDGDEILVTNGVYKTGGRISDSGILTNRVLIDKPALLRSVNGPTFTTILGYQIPGTFYGNQAVRGVYLTNDAQIDGFTISNGGSVLFINLFLNDNQGGGIYCASTNETVSNCIISGNTTDYEGGGAFGGIYSNCVISNNFVTHGGNGLFGGGVSSATLNGCIISQNYAYEGGGASDCILNNCILTNNVAVWKGGGVSQSFLNGCQLIGNAMTNMSLSSYGGGGAYGCTLTNCSLSRNFALEGGGAYRSTLLSSTLTGNSAGGLGGGGGWVCTFGNCLLVNNSATGFSAGFGIGGGARFGYLTNCILAENTADGSGGGAISASLTNCLLWGNTSGTGGGAALATLTSCTLVSNSATISGGGAFSSTLNNSIVYFNGAPTDLNYDASTVLNYCCTIPLPTNGSSNITFDPMLLNWANANFHLQSNSPCINSGNNSYGANTTDLDGNPRIVGGTVDIGAYEFQHPASLISYAWLQKYDLPIDGAADYTDPDHDGMNNWQEWIAGTEPISAVSVLKMLAPSNSTSGVEVSWLSVPNKNYILTRGTTFAPQPAFVTLATDIPGQTNTTTFIDTNVIGAGASFYRVGVQGNP